MMTTSKMISRAILPLVLAGMALAACQVHPTPAPPALGTGQGASLRVDAELAERQLLAVVPSWDRGQITALELKLFSLGTLGAETEITSTTLSQAQMGASGALAKAVTFKHLKYDQAYRVRAYARNGATAMSIEADSFVDVTPTLAAPDPAVTLKVVLATNPFGATAQAPGISVTPGVYVPRGVVGTVGGIFTLPYDVAAAADGNVYFTTLSTGKIHTISPAGDISAHATTFKQPQGLAVDSSGNIYLAEAGAHLIRQISPAGAVTTVAGVADTSGSDDDPDGNDNPATSATFNGPADVAVDAGGNLFVADRFNDKIRKITPAGVVSTFATVYRPRRLALDAAGNLLVTNNSPHILRITPAGVASTLAGNGVTAGYLDAPVGTDARFDSVWGVTVDVAGNVYVTDVNQADDYSRIRKISPGGAVTTLAGQALSASTDAPKGTDAAFMSAYGVAFAANGALYVSETGGNKIRKIL